MLLPRLLEAVLRAQAVGRLAEEVAVACLLEVAVLRAVACLLAEVPEVAARRVEAVQAAALEEVECLAVAALEVGLACRVAVVPAGLAEAPYLHPRAVADKAA